MHALVGAIDGDAAAVAASPAALAAGFAAAHVAQKGVEEGRMGETGDPLNSGATAIALLSGVDALGGGGGRLRRRARRPLRLRRRARVPLSTEHKVDEPEERARIEAAGGTCATRTPTPTAARGRRGCTARPSRGPGLAISRAFGDLLAARVGLRTPQITRFELESPSPPPPARVRATARTWSSRAGRSRTPSSSSSAPTGCGSTWSCRRRATRVPAAHGAAARDGAAALLVKTAAARWKREEGDYRDDMTATVLYLPCF